MGSYPPYMQKLTLPVTSSILSFGAGLKAKSNIFHASYIASLALTNKIVAKMTPIYSLNTVEVQCILTARECSKNKIPVSEIIKFTDKIIGNTSKNALTCQFIASLKEIPDGHTRTKAFRRSKVAHGAKDWLKFNSSL